MSNPSLSNLCPECLEEKPCGGHQHAPGSRGGSGPLPVAEALELADRALFFSGQEGRERARETLRLLGEVFSQHRPGEYMDQAGWDAYRVLLAAEEESDAD